MAEDIHGEDSPGRRGDSQCSECGKWGLFLEMEKQGQESLVRGWRLDAKSWDVGK